MFFLTFGMEQITREPTHISLNSMHLLDLIFTNIRELLDVRVIDSNIADHFVTSFKLKIFKSAHQQKKNKFFLQIFKKNKF